MKRMTGFMAALFLVLGIAATSGFAQDNTMKQQDTMTKQTDTMMSSKKPPPRALMLVFRDWRDLK